VAILNSLYLRLWATLLALALALPAMAQPNMPPQEAYVLEKVLDEKINDFEVDNLGQLYLLLPNQRLKKLGHELDSVAVFNDVRKYGQLYSIDASNPLRLLLYYREYATVVLLDRFLNIRTTIDLRKTGIIQCNAIAQSVDNNIWLFDEMENQIKKVDENGKLIVSSPDFRVIFDQPPHPHDLEDFNRNLFAYDSTRGLLVMDYFGASRGMLPYKGWRNLHGMGKGLVATDDKGLIYYEPGKPGYSSQTLPAALLHAVKIRVQGSRLYALFDNGELHIYHNSP
jgi:hypothetical protein